MKRHAMCTRRVSGKEVLSGKLAKAAIFLCMIVFGLGMAGVPAKSADDPMAVYYDNTLTCQGGETDNWLCYVWYYPAGYYREFQVIRRRDGFIALHGVEGTFKVTKTKNGEAVCQTADEGAHTWCQPLAPRTVGDRWEEKLANGQTQRFSLLKGRLLLNFLSGAGTDTHILAPFKYPDYPPDPSRVMQDIGGAAAR